METLLSNKLNDRLLCYDGDSIIKAADIYNYITEFNSEKKKLFVDALNSDLVRYNSLVGDVDKIKVKTSMHFDEIQWNIPFDEIGDPLIFIQENFMKVIENESEEYIQEAEKRIALEYKLFKKLKLIDLLKTCIYIVKKFTEHNVVWGTGRGSSCASYILYVIGLHDVDSIKYELDYKEFFKIDI